MTVRSSVERLKFHAGLRTANLEEGVSVADCTWPPGRLSADLEDAASDCINALTELNRMMNGNTPSASDFKADTIPREIVYAMLEIIRMLRECKNGATDSSTVKELETLIWRLETAWTWVVAGDIDDIQGDLHTAESFRQG